MQVMEINRLYLGGNALFCCQLEGALEENIGAVSVELTPDDLNEIGTAASEIQVQGNRYPERLEQMTGR